MKRLLAFLLAFTFLLGVALSEEEAIPPIEEPIVEVQEEAEVVEPIEEEEPPIEELPEEVAEAPPEELPIEEEEQPEELVEESVAEPEPELEPIESEEEPSEMPTEVEISEEILTTPTPEPETVEEEQETIVEETETIVEEEVEEIIESEEIIVPEELIEIAEGDWGYVDPEMLPREVHISFLVEPHYFGDEATIIATLVNFRSNDHYTIYWQYCENVNAAEPTWQEIPGERGRTYSFIVTKENYLYGYRVLVEMEDE